MDKFYLLSDEDYTSLCKNGYKQAYVIREANVETTIPMDYMLLKVTLLNKQDKQKVVHLGIYEDIRDNLNYLRWYEGDYHENC